MINKILIDASQGEGRRESSSGGERSVFADPRVGGAWHLRDPESKQAGLKCREMGGQGDDLR